jgi:hypothetical protein
LFVYKRPNGKWRTLIFGKSGVEYDSSALRFAAVPLANLCFANGTIYDPNAGKIVGINPLKGTAREFTCAVVNEASALRFEAGGFVIVGDTQICRFG